jgi:MYXO-CTERM domain-containing protein
VALVIDDAGATYPVRVDPMMWTQQAELTASDGGANDEFGFAVSVSGGMALVGAPNHQVGANASQGAAYVFVQSGTTWTQQAELTASDGMEGDDFGISVSVSGGTALVGADNHQAGANANTGAAYVFVPGGASGSSSSSSASSCSGSSSGTTSSTSSSSGTTSSTSSSSGTTSSTSSSSGTSSGGGAGGGGAGGVGTGSSCSITAAGEPTPHDRSLLAAVAAMAMAIGLRRRPRRGARLASTLRGLY